MRIIRLIKRLMQKSKLMRCVLELLRQSGAIHLLHVVISRNEVIRARGGNSLFSKYYLDHKREFKKVYELS